MIRMMICTAIRHMTAQSRKNPYKNNRSVYANAQPAAVATMVHVEV